MSFSVGILYSAVAFLEMLDQKPIQVQDFQGSFDRYILADAEEVLKVCQQCSWITLNNEGYIYPTEHGKRLVGGHYKVALRHQIRDMISVQQPAWSKRMRHGRAEVVGYLKEDVRQCFKEAGLFDDWSPELIGWWDELSLAANSRRSSELLEVGRQAEKLSIGHESRRTGAQPKWQALESNFSGYDVLSRVSHEDSTPLKIEVKGTTLKRKEAQFYLTKNEWSVAEVSDYYKFHLWLLSSSPPELIEVDRTEILCHLPSNNGNGQWESVRIPFASVN